MSKILYIPRFMSEEELKRAGIQGDATVEAEYGDQVIQGSQITLAHHANGYTHYPAPCNDPRAQKLSMPNPTILVSHLDLDTIGGCLTLLGQKPEAPEFWEAAGFIDCNGVHKLFLLSEELQDQLNAWYAYFSKEKKYFSEITDVTETVLNTVPIIKRIVKNDPILLDAGRLWFQERSDAVEACLIYEDDTFRVFRTDGSVFCSAQYYSKNTNHLAKATISLNTTKKTITIAFEDGGKELSAKQIAQELWGGEAGGHRGIAGSPRDQALADPEKELQRAVWRLKTLYQE